MPIIDDCCEQYLFRFFFQCEHFSFGNQMLTGTTPIGKSGKKICTDERIQKVASSKNSNQQEVERTASSKHGREGR